VGNWVQGCLSSTSACHWRVGRRRSATGRPRVVLVTPSRVPPDAADPDLEQVLASATTTQVPSPHRAELTGYDNTSKA
jgi:hypothetical protein